jgi:DNA-binding HxlR family transcriptional regulator
MLYNNAVATRSYGQYCGFARALEIVGERWGLLIVRDLLVGRKRFSDLQRGLPKIPSNVLSTRLKELEAAGVVERKAVARADGGGVAYELTAGGRELEPAVVALGRWGAKRLGEMRDDEIVTEDSLRSALTTVFRPEAAAGPRVAYELRVGSIVLNAIVENGAAAVGAGAVSSPDLVIEAGPGIRAVMAGEIEPGEAVDSGIVRLKGRFTDFERFARMFRI